MLDNIDKLRFGLVLPIVTIIGLGLSTESVLAAEDKEKEVSVDCDKGESVQDVLDSNITNSKPLVIIIKGTCDEELDEGFEVERDKVIFEGYEDVGGYLAKPLIVNGSRNVQIDDGMKLHSLYVSSGEVSIEAGGDVTIENEVFLVRQSSFTIDTDPEDEEEDTSAGLVTINGPITIQGHSLLSVQSRVSGGEVILNGMLFARLQSSMDLSHASVNDIVLESDSHVLLGEGLTAANGVITFVTCDQQSRAWGESPADFFFNAVPGTLTGETCKTP